MLYTVPKPQIYMYLSVEISMKPFKTFEKKYILYVYFAADWQRGQLIFVLNSQRPTEWEIQTEHIDNSSRHMFMVSFLHHYYRPQRSCGQGYVFTRVCDSVHGGGSPGRETPPDRQTPPPPRKQTPEYGLRAAGTHPTGMHACLSHLIPLWACFR